MNDLDNRQAGVCTWVTVTPVKSKDNFTSTRTFAIIYYPHQSLNLTLTAYLELMALDCQVAASAWVSVPESLQGFRSERPSSLNSAHPLIMTSNTIKTRTTV